MNDVFLPVGGEPRFRREGVIWAAGLFEGEGCVSLRRAMKGNHIEYAYLQLKMTDKAIVERFRDVFGFGCGHVEKQVNPKWNDTYGNNYF